MMSNGQITFILLVAAILSLPLSFALLWLYRRAVLAAMRRTSGSARRIPSTEPQTPPAALVPVDLQLDLLEPRSTVGSLTADGGAAIFERAERGPWVNALVYGIAGLAAAIVSMIVNTIDSGAGFAPLRVLILTWVAAWPVALTTNLLVARGRRDQLRVMGAYFGGLLLLALTQREIWYQIVLLWAIFALPPTIYQLIFLQRKLRAVGPLVILFMLVGVLGTEVGLTLLGTPTGLNLARIPLGVLTADELIGVVVVIGFAVFGLLGWRALGWLARRYEAKQVSDQSLTIDALWLVFIVNQALLSSSSSGVLAVLGLSGFVVYKLVAWQGFAIAARRSRGQINQRLLLLRVFGSEGRSERLMDRVGQRWRYVGNIQLIAGTDLAADALEPHELLEFVRGRLKYRYIADSEALERQFGQIDVEPDQDGRFRMAEFFCYDDTWRMTLSRLAQSSDAVLMDLRTFSPGNQGCIFELRELANRVPLQRVVLLVDNTTDIDFLRDVLREAGQNLAAGSPNAQSGPVRVSTCRLGADERASSRLVLARLTAAASVGGTRLLSPAIATATVAGLGGG